MIFGVAFLAIGISGFIPGLSTPPHPGHPELVVDTGYRQALGLFPVNVLHNIVHILFGIWGLLSSKSIGAAKGYARSVAIIYGVLTIAGMIEGLNTMFGLVPLFGNDIWLHFLLAAIAAYFGWMHRDIAATSTIR
jgi:hypothetical protein